MKGKDFTRELREPRPGEIEAFLSRHGVRKMEPMPGGELRFAPCPVCRNVKRSGAVRTATSATVNLKTGLWKCYDGACRAAGNWLTLTRAFGDELPRADRYKDQRPEDTWALRDRFAGQSRERLTIGRYRALLDYWTQERLISPETLDRCLVSAADPYTVRWPLHAWQEGKWVMVNAKLKRCLDRRPDESSTRFEYAGGPTQLAIGQHLVSKENGPHVLLFEGEADYMTAIQLGLGNALSIPNGASAIHVGSILRYIPDDWKIYVGMDMDEAGRKAVEAFFAQVDPRRLMQFILPENPNAEPDEKGKRPPYKDLNDWYRGTAGQLTAGDVMCTASGIGILKPVETPALVSLGQIQMRVASRQGDIAEKPRIVCQLPWPALNGIFKGGLLSKMTTGLLAPSGIGKTTFANQIGVHAAGGGCKTGLISIEDAREDLEENLNQVALGWLQVDDIARAADNLLVSPLEGSSVTGEQIVDELVRMANLGCRLTLVDNLDHCAGPGDSGMNMKTMVYKAIIEVAKQYDMHVIVVWQCNKVDRGLVVNSGNQKGYGQTFLDSSNYVNMNRLVVGGEERTRIEVEKARAAGTSFTKSQVWLQYVEAKRCFFQVEGNVVSLSNGGGVGVAPF